MGLYRRIFKGFHEPTAQGSKLSVGRNSTDFHLTGIAEAMATFHFQKVVNCFILVLRIEVLIHIYYVALEGSQMSKVTQKRAEGHARPPDDPDI
jgi:hypothetical protein